MPTNKPYESNRLTPNQRLDLGLLMRSHYASSGMSVTKWSEHASQQLGFTVRPQNVNHMRRSLGLPVAVRAPSKPLDPAVVEGRRAKLRAKALRAQHRLALAQARLKAARAMAARLDHKLAALPASVGAS